MSRTSSAAYQADGFAASQAPLGQLFGVDYGPFQGAETPNGGPYPTPAQIDADMSKLAGMANAVRIYSVSNGLGYIVQSAAAHGLEAIPSAYLNDPTTASGLAANQTEIANLIAILNNPGTDLSKIPFVVVGSEFLLNNPGQYDYLLQQIQYVKSNVPAGIKVTTAEIWYNYLTAYPDLGNHVDLVFANIFPYWEPGGIALADAAAFIASKYWDLGKHYSKDVVISETGWPSVGANGNAVGSVANEEAFWGQFLPLAQQKGISFFGFEAFDEPWKTIEGAPGPHWGLYDANRMPKGSVITFEPRIIESNGSTRLVQIGNEYFLQDSSGNGLTLSSGGSPVVVGEFGQYAPISAEQTSSGYEVAWRWGNADNYVVWNTDSNGNPTTTPTPPGGVSGSDPRLEALEPSFHQDLNGDGTIGVPSSTIEAVGVTTLVQVGNEFFLQDSSGNGPALRFGGSPVVVGEFGLYMPIGAEQTASGYEVAWRWDNADNYVVWNTDTDGNSTTTPTPPGGVSGSDPRLEALEPSLHQDLNGDGTIGVPSSTIEAVGVTTLVQIGNEYFLQDSGGNGPALRIDGSPVVAGEFGQYTPIGAEQISSGYEVAWRWGNSDNYVVWNTDTNGNLTTAFGPVSGSDPRLEGLEPGFHQDLNGDGFIGVFRPLV